MKTHNQKLNAIKKAIRTDFPRLAFGNANEIEATHKKDKTYVKIIPNNQKTGNNFCITEITANDNEIIVLDKEPMLNDVLMWIDKVSDYTTESLVKETTLRISIHSLCVLEWDLEQPYLKDQSKEFINTLHNEFIK